jgi:hypothetical protein
MFAFVIVLFVLVALAAASFFRHKLAAFVALLGLPLLVLLHALFGTFYAVFAFAGLAIFIALVETISSSLSLLREANTPRMRSPSAERHRSSRRSSRRRIAA